MIAVKFKDNTFFKYYDQIMFRADKSSGFNNPKITLVRDGSVTTVKEDQIKKMESHSGNNTLSHINKLKFTPELDKYLDNLDVNLASQKKETKEYDPFKKENKIFYGI